MRRITLALTLVLALVLPLAAGAAEVSVGDPAAEQLAAEVAAELAAPRDADGPSTEGIGSPNMSHVGNVQWDDAHRAADGRTIDTQGGTDLEVLTSDGRDYAFVGTSSNGLQVIDITDRDAPVHVTTYDCKVLQGDVQAFQRTSDDGTVKSYVLYAADDGYSGNARQAACWDDFAARGGERFTANGSLVIEVTDPENPVMVGFAEIGGGSHNMTLDPNGLWLYNSNSDGVVRNGTIEVISLADPTNPQLVSTLTLSGESAHDITFNADGTRAYAAALNHTVVIDTSDLANPTIISEIRDPAVSLHHQADPITIGGRTFVVVNDELAGAAGNEVCPGGGLHVYEVTGELEATPVKVGAFFVPEFTVRDGADTGTGGTVTCTSHVFRIYEEQQLLVIAWFGAGVHVLDLSGLADVTVALDAGITVEGEQTQTAMAIREVGYYRFADDSDAWSAKVMDFEPDGSAYVYANDQTRGLDVFRYDAAAAPAADEGMWLDATAAKQRAIDVPPLTSLGSLLPYCQLRVA